MSTIKEQEKIWVMPEWMEKYRSFISIGDERENSTTSVEDLMNDKYTNSFNNTYRWAMIINVKSKVQLLNRLMKEGILNK